MKFLFAFVLTTYSMLIEANSCRGAKETDIAAIESQVKEEAVKSWYHQLVLQLDSKIYYGEKNSPSEYSKCLPINGTIVMVLKKKDFCYKDIGKIKEYINLYNNIVNQTLINKTDCSMYKLRKVQTEKAMTNLWTKSDDNPVDG